MARVAAGPGRLDDTDPSPRRPAAALLAAGRPEPLTALVVALRWSTIAIGVLIAMSKLAHDSGSEIAAVILLVNAAWRTLRPLDADQRRAGSVHLLLDLAITFGAVTASGRWSSPFVFALVVPVFLVGFGGGYVQGFLIASLTVVATTGVHAAFQSLALARRDITSAVLVLELTALLAGYARHVFVEAQEIGRAHV